MSTCPGITSVFRTCLFCVDGRFWGWFPVMVEDAYQRGQSRNRIQVWEIIPESPGFHRHDWKVLPNGVRERRAILKCCSPNGIPMMVMQQISPQTRCAAAISHQPRRIQSIFMNMLRQPPAFLLSTTSVPNGHKENTPNFHNW